MRWDSFAYSYTFTFCKDWSDTSKFKKVFNGRTFRTTPPLLWMFNFEMIYVPFFKKKTCLIIKLLLYLTKNDLIWSHIGASLLMLCGGPLKSWLEATTAVENGQALLLHTLLYRSRHKPFILHVVLRVNTLRKQMLSCHSNIVHTRGAIIS